MKQQYTEIAELANAYRAVTARLRDAVHAKFRYGADVFVNCQGRYVGPGKCAGIGDSPDHVAVLLGNGNVWDYPAEHVRLLEDKDLST